MKKIWRKHCRICLPLPDIRRTRLLPSPYRRMSSPDVFRPCHGLFLCQFRFPRTRRQTVSPEVLPRPLVSPEVLPRPPASPAASLRLPVSLSFRPRLSGDPALCDKNHVFRQKKTRRNAIYKRNQHHSVQYRKNQINSGLIPLPAVPAPTFL